MKVGCIDLCDMVGDAMGSGDIEGATVDGETKLGCAP